MIEVAKTLLQHGINPLATSMDKRPLSHWNGLQHQLLTTDALPDMFGRASAIAAINGQINGGLMGLDFEGQSHGVDCLFDAWWDSLKSEAKALADRLVYHTTGGGGYHVRFRCPDGVRASQDLAKSQEKQMLVELKGEGGELGCATYYHRSRVRVSAPQLSTTGSIGYRAQNQTGAKNKTSAPSGKRPIA